MYCKGHQKGDAIMAQGNCLAGHVAKLAAAKEMASPMALTASLFPKWDPKYLPQE